MNYRIPEKELLDYKNKIVMQLVNTEWNKELLKSVPHKELLNLSIIYRFFRNGVDDDGDMDAKYNIINYNLMERMGINDQELFGYAYWSHRNILPPKIIEMEHLLNSLKGADFPSQYSEDSGKPAMYVVLNEQGIFGATSILYSETLDTLAEMFGGDFYILPSSTHEIITVKSSQGIDLSKLIQTVKEVNRDLVNRDNRLSDDVYIYRNNQRRIYRLKEGD